MASKKPPAYQWLRRDDESPQAYAGFKAYLDMGETRSVRGVARNVEKSHQLILACWYMGETEDIRSEVKSDTTSPMYTGGVELAKQNAVIAPAVEDANARRSKRRWRERRVVECAGSMAIASLPIIRSSSTGSPQST